MEQQKFPHTVLHTLSSIILRCVSGHTQWVWLRKLPDKMTRIDWDLFTRNVPLTQFT